MEDDSGDMDDHSGDMDDHSGESNSYDNHPTCQPHRRPSVIQLNPMYSHPTLRQQIFKS